MGCGSCEVDESFGHEAARQVFPDVAFDIERWSKDHLTTLKDVDRKVAVPFALACAERVYHFIEDAYPPDSSEENTIRDAACAALNLAREAPRRPFSDYRFFYEMTERLVPVVSRRIREALVVDNAAAAIRYRGALNALLACGSAALASYNTLWTYTPDPFYEDTCLSHANDEEDGRQVVISRNHSGTHAGEAANYAYIASASAGPGGMAEMIDWQSNWLSEKILDIGVGK